MKKFVFFMSLVVYLNVGTSEAKRVFRAKIKRNAAFNLTLSLFKVDVGSIGGHTKPAEQMMDTARSEVHYAVQENTLIDGFVFHIGDDICLLMSHDKGLDSPVIYDFATKCFTLVNEVAKKLGCSGHNEEIMPPHIVEMSFDHSLGDFRPVESFMVFATHKNETNSQSIWDMIGWGSESGSDSMVLVRTQGDFSRPEQILLPFTQSQLLPVPINTPATGPLGIGIVCCVGFSINKNGQFSENYVDFFDNPAWDWVRLRAQERCLS